MEMGRLTQKTLNEYKAIPFDDFPAESEEAGFGANEGKRYRTLQVEAINDYGKEHRYTLRWTRFMPPLELLKMKLAKAENKLQKHQNKDTSKVKDFGAYCDLLTRLDARVAELRRALHFAQQYDEPSTRARADKLKVTDHGPTARQVDINRAERKAENARRPSAAFLRSIMAGADVAPNETQWDILADFVEEMSDQSPFFFMGPAWVPVLEKANAIEVDSEGKPQACGDKLRASYKAFQTSREVA